MICGVADEAKLINCEDVVEVVCICICIYIMNILYIIQQINIYFPTYNIKYKLDEDTHDLRLYISMIKNKIIIITINKNKNKTIEEIIKYIEQKLYNESLNNNECSICFNENNYCKIYCIQCTGDWCMNCYIDIFRKNEGIIICPFCRYIYGHKCPKNMIEKKISQTLPTSFSEFNVSVSSATPLRLQTIDYSNNIISFSNSGVSFFDSISLPNENQGDLDFLMAEEIIKKKLFYRLFIVLYCIFLFIIIKDIVGEVKLKTKSMY